MSKLYTQEHVEKLVALAFANGQAFAVESMIKDAQARLEKVQPTPNKQQAHIVRLCKEKQDILMEPVPNGADEFTVACEQEASIHYLDEEISAAS